MQKTKRNRGKKHHRYLVTPVKVVGALYFRSSLEGKEGTRDRGNDFRFSNCFLGRNRAFRIELALLLRGRRRGGSKYALREGLNIGGGVENAPRQRRVDGEAHIPPENFE